MFNRPNLLISMVLLESCIFTYVSSLNSNALQRNFHMQRHQGLRLSNCYQKLVARSVFDCGAQCCNDSQCAAANFNAVSRKCEFSSDTFGTGSQEESSEWEVLDRQVWFAFGDHEYMLIDSKGTWEVAKETCESFNAYLTDISSAEENKFIAKLVEDSPDGFWWVGGNDQNHEGVWTWLSGSPMATTYSNWAHGEPNGFGEEFCLLFHQGYWHDGACEWSTKGVCKRP